MKRRKMKKKQSDWDEEEDDDDNTMDVYMVSYWEGCKRGEKRSRDEAVISPSLSLVI